MSKTREQRRRRRRQDWLFLAMCAALFILAHLVAGEAAETPREPVKARMIAIPPPAAADPVEEPMEAVEEPESAMRYVGEFQVSHYCCEAYAHICGTGDGLTATGTQVTAYRSCAVDPDVIPLGSEVQLHMADGRILYYIAEDTGGSIRGNKIDLALPSHEEALAAGITTASVYVLAE